MRFTYAKQAFYLFVFQHLLYGYLHHVGCHHGLEAKDGHAVFGDQELTKVPADGITLVEARSSLLVNFIKHCRKLFDTLGIAFERCLFLEVSVERALCFTVDVNLVEQREGDIVVQRAEALNLLVGAWLLAQELVAGEAKNLQALILVLLIKGFKAFVLWGQTAFASHIDDEQHLAFVVGQQHIASVHVFDRDIVDTTGLLNHRFRFSRDLGGLVVLIVAARSHHQSHCSEIE